MSHPKTKLERRHAYHKKYKSLLNSGVCGWDEVGRWVPPKYTWREEMEIGIRELPGDYRKEYASYYVEDGRSTKKQFLKTQSNRAIRRYQGEVTNGRFAHKIFDYWYSLL